MKSVGKCVQGLLLYGALHVTLQVIDVALGNAQCTLFSSVSFQRNSVVLILSVFCLGVRCIFHNKKNDTFI